MNRRTFLQSIIVTAYLPSVLHQENKLTIDSMRDPNELICLKKFELSRSLKLHEKPIHIIFLEIAKSFLGAKYSAHALEAPGKERLIVNLQTLDCVTFYENSLVLARCVKKNILTFDEYKKQLQFIRYRGGIIDEYPSRLHYTSDYFYDNEKKGVLKNVTREIGGIPYNKTVNFISTHPESYLRLKESPEFVQAIQKIEHEMNNRVMYHIPKKKVEKDASHIKDGDIVAITTNIEGLDCSHTGIAIWQNKKLYLLHAPAPGQKVQITEVPLGDYLAKIKKDVGIIVARPLEP
jgi:hypothetical protein